MGFLLDIASTCLNKFSKRLWSNVIFLLQNRPSQLRSFFIFLTSAVKFIYSIRLHSLISVGDVPNYRPHISMINKYFSWKCAQLFCSRYSKNKAIISPVGAAVLKVDDALHLAKCSKVVPKFTVLCALYYNCNIYQRYTLKIIVN